MNVSKITVYIFLYQSNAQLKKKNLQNTQASMLALAYLHSVHSALWKSRPAPQAARRWY